MSTKRVFTFLMLVAMLLTGAILTQAQTAASGEYTGVLEARNGDALTVSGLTFDISTAKISPNLAMEPGALAEISFSVTNGQLSAVSVEAAEADEPATVGKVTGLIEAVDANSVVIGGLTFNLTDARIDTDMIFEVGKPAEIRFTYAEGIFSAYRVEPDDLDTEDDNEDEPKDSVIYGLIDAIEGSTISVAGMIFDITIAEVDTDGTLAIGVWVRVEFMITESGLAQALDIEFDDDTQPDTDNNTSSTLVGTLDSFEGAVMVVGGVTIDVSQATLDADDQFVIGKLVKVEFEDIDGVSVATSVEVVNDIDDVDDEFEDDDQFDDTDDTENTDDHDDDSCQIPAGWYEYEIQGGDTLGGIAIAAGIGLSELMTANCITDASLIRVDDEIYTPVRISSSSDDDDSEDDNDNDSDNDDDNDDSDDSDDDSDDDNDDDSDDSDDDDDDSDDSDDDDDDDSDDSDDDDDDDSDDSDDDNDD